MNFVMWHIWVIAGLVLLIAEIFTPGFVVGVFGIACLGAALGAGYGLTFDLQLLSFGILSGIGALTIRPLFLRYFYKTDSSCSTNVDALIGQTAYVLEKIDPKVRSGRIKIAGEEWKASSLDGALVDVAAKVVVRKVEGCTLLVETPKPQGRTE